ncbi:unnamed protein product [Orchesella dallaii]|uniref:Uncharacterized protein n=1 Tax=Orchesella dallaii TaxID=48710 RepID=A0ABP1RIW9_9HEXA
MKLNYLHFLAIASVLLNYLSVYETKSVCQNSHYDSLFRIKRSGPPSFDLSKLEKPTTSLDTSVVKVPITNKSNAAKLARIAKKAEAAAQKAQIPEDLMLDKTEKFKEKHLFQHDISEGNVDSFTELTSDPYFAKKYLVERNRNLINGEVLPQWDDKNVKRWFKDAGKTKITIVDAPLETLQQDIEPAFQEWKKTLPKDANNNIIFPAKASDFENLKTTGEYDMTEISYETFDEGDGKLGVYVNFKKLHGKLELGTNDLGQITHFEKPLVSELATGFGDKGEVSGGVDIGVVQEKNHFVKFTSAELDQNRQLTNDFWTNLKATNNKKKLNSVLNPNGEGYKEFVSENDIELERSVLNPPKREEILTNIEDADDGVNTGGDTSDGVGKRRGTSGIRERSPICTPGERRRKRRRRAAYAAGLSPCAIFLKPNGDVETILAEEFVDEYTKADAKMKKELTDSAKDNMDKLDLDDDIDGDHDDYGGAYKKVAKLVQLEDMKSHVDGVEAVTSFQSDDYDYSQNQPTKGRIRQSIGDVVDTVSGKLSGIKSKVKMSMTKTGHALREGITEFGESIKNSVGTMKAVVSTAFMAKTIIKGILKGDALSLSIVGTQIGFQTAVWAGQKFFSAASKVSKASKFLSKWAGPVGAMIDIGFNMYSIGKSIERLNKATNKWDRNDAIIDIVSTSVDMYVNYAVFVISTAFPPIAPLMDLINIIVDILNKIITGIFKAWNEVDRIDSEIGLLDFEKDEVFNSRIMDWFGQRKKDYLEYLVEEKKANDMAVEHNKKSLENNSFLLGIVFPSRTLAYEGGCRLTKEQCAFDLFGCWVWEELVEVGRGCDHHRQCGPRLCMTKYEYIESSEAGYDLYTCKCDKEAETSFGYARQNSVVDFTTKRNLYWERAVPKEVDGAEFKCKPGALNFADYKLHKMTSRWDYWCKDAIAILQPQNKRKEGQVMLFDLQEGHDKVFAGSDNTPNLFRMGNEGLKEFYGSNGRNEFLFDGNCSSSLKGNLTGGASDTDAITIMSSCAEGQYVHVNFTSGVLVSRV